MTKEKTLAEVRSEIDAIDDKIHDLIMARAELIEDIIQAKKQLSEEKKPIIHHARETAIIKRLLKRHKGPFPKEVLIRMWREMFSAFVNMQRSFEMAVYMPERGAGFLETARDHFGTHSKTRTSTSIVQVIKDVADWNVEVGVIPAQVEQEDANPWWLSLLPGNGWDAPQIVAKLPLSNGRDISSSQEAFVISMGEFEPTSDDRSLVAIETRGKSSASSIGTDLEKTGFPVRAVLGMHNAQEEDRFYLFELEGYFNKNDAKVEAFIEKEADNIVRIECLGGYSVIE